MGATIGNSLRTTSKAPRLVMERFTIALSGIAIPMERLRALRQDAVDTLAESMKRTGLIHPVTLRRRAGRGYWIVAGAHRLAAAEKLRWKEIDCVIIEDCSDDEAALVEIDENLIRAELSAAENAMHTGRRKEIYERLHPQTKHGGDHKSAKAKSNGQDGHLNERFTKDTAANSGQSERNVRRDASRAKQLGDELPRIAGTSLDKGAELDALAKMPKEQRAPLIERAVAGEKVSAICRPEPARHPELTRAWNAFRLSWLKASADDRADFHTENKKQISAIFGASDGYEERAVILFSAGLLDLA